MCLVLMYVLTCTCVGIHLGRVELASSVELATSLTPGSTGLYELTRDVHPVLSPSGVAANPRSGEGLSSVLIVVAYVFNWPPVHLCHVRGSVGRSRPKLHSCRGCQYHPRLATARLKGVTMSDSLFLRARHGGESEWLRLRWAGVFMPCPIRKPLASTLTFLVYIRGGKRITVK